MPAVQTNKETLRCGCTKAARSKRPNTPYNYRMTISQYNMLTGMHTRNTNKPEPKSGIICHCISIDATCKTPLTASPHTPPKRKYTYSTQEKPYGRCKACPTARGTTYAAACMYQEQQSTPPIATPPIHMSGTSLANTHSTLITRLPTSPEGRPMGANEVSQGQKHQRMTTDPDITHDMDRRYRPEPETKSILRLLPPSYSSCPPPPPAAIPPLDPMPSNAFFFPLPPLLTSSIN